MIRIGTVSYNIYCNFTNYGSALQTWALHQAIKKTAGDSIQPVLVDYCPDVLSDMEPLNPYKNMWDRNEESMRMVQRSMVAIRENYEKFNCFYRERFARTRKKYTSDNFNNVIEDESISGFVCGSDTIFCIDEFKGFDDGYYGNYPAMQGRTVAYAASFGDAHFDECSYAILRERLHNFLAIGLRENRMLPYVRAHTSIPVERTIDPTLLLTSEDYDALVAPRQCCRPYLLLYARRYDAKMEEHADRIAREMGLDIVEISLRASNTDKGHIMRYDAGVEEFLSLVKHASFVVTNSYHGLIFAVLYRRAIAVFTREQADNKITELWDLLGLNTNGLTNEERTYQEIDYDAVHARIAQARATSANFLKMELALLCI